MLPTKLRELKKLKDLSSIQEVLNRASEIFGNAVMINDTSYNLLCYSEGVITDDPIWNELLSLGTFSHETVNFFKAENFISEYATTENVALMRTDKLKYDRINGRLFDKDGVQLANALVLCCNKPLVSEDFEMLEVLCDILSVHLQNSTLYSRIDRVYQETIFNKLLDGELLGNRDDMAKIAKLYDNLGRNIYVAVADTSQYDETFTHLAYFRDVFRKTCPNFFYFIHKENVAIILSTDNSSLNVERDMGALNDFFKKNRIYAGISDSFQNLNDANKYAKQAYAALNYGQKSGWDSQFFNYSDYRTEHILLKSNFNLKELYDPTALRMKEYDAANSTNFSDLLYNYILYGMNRHAICKRLDIDAASLDNHLAAIFNLFDIDATNGDMLMNIYITLKLIKAAANKTVEKIHFKSRSKNDKETTLINI